MNFPFFGDKIICTVSRLVDGSMKLHAHDKLDQIFSIDKPALENRERFFKSIGIPAENVVDGELVHGAHAEVIGAPPFAPKVRIKNVDTLITANKDVALAVTNADCPTVFFYDPIGEVVGISHAGWKGILNGVLENAVEKMEKEFNTDPGKLEVFLGPGIRECHFEVGKDVYDKFRPFGVEKTVQAPKNPPIEDRGNNDTYDWTKRYYVDLFGAIKERLVQSGVRREAIGDANQCTFCYKALTELKPLPNKSVLEYQYYSFRRDKSDPLEAQVAVIYMKP